METTYTQLSSKYSSLYKSELYSILECCLNLFYIDQNDEFNNISIEVIEYILASRI